MKRPAAFLAKIFISDWQHVQNAAVRSRYGFLSGILSVGVNSLLVLLKAWLGFVTGAVSLIADAVHSFSDIGTSAVIVLSFKFSKKPADRKHPYGHERAEPIATLIVAIILIVAGLETGREALPRLFNPKPISISWVFIGLVFSTVIVKEILARLTFEWAKMIKSSALHADSWHHRLDSFSSLIVIAALIGQRFQIYALDGAAGIIVSVIIIITGWRIARDGADDLIGRHPPEALVNQVKEKTLSFSGVTGVHDLIIHQYGQKSFMSFHITVPETMTLKKAHTLSHTIADQIDKDFYTHTTVHVDPAGFKSAEEHNISSRMQDFFQAYDRAWELCEINLNEKDGMKQVRLVMRSKIKHDPGMEKTMKNDLENKIKSSFPEISDVIIKIKPEFIL